MIYIVTHKNVPLPELTGYQPIQVGGATDAFPGCIRDNTGDNISDMNAQYCELTALYWIWKNTDDKFKGLVHYRRYFGRRMLSSSEKDILREDELQDMLKQSDIVAARPTVYHVNAREQLLMECCSRENFDRLASILKTVRPAYADSFDSFFSGNRASQYNMMYCARELFDAYCEWLFPMLFRLGEQADLTDANAYQQRLYGFLAERLMNVWMLGSRLRVKTAPVVSTAYSLSDHLTYLRRDITNGIRFSLGGKKA